MKGMIKKIVSILRNIYKIDIIIETKIREREYLKNALYSKEFGINKYRENQENIIVSLTTYNKRIYEVYLVIESLFQQTLKPNKIILWLAEDEFNCENIPLILKKQQERGLEIGFCKDIKSYKKLIPTLKKYPNDVIITVDDDIMYPMDLVENLVKKYKQNSDSVICYRAKIYGFEHNNQLKPYLEWKNSEEAMKKEGLQKLFLTTGGGTLFFKNCFTEVFYNEKIFLELAPTADDVWVNANLLKNDIKVLKVGDERQWNERFLRIEKAQDIALFNTNKSQNDIQIKKVFEYFELKGKIN